MEDGAPYEDLDGNGEYTPGVDVPQFVGDEVLWYVSNDMDGTRSSIHMVPCQWGLSFRQLFLLLTEAVTLVIWYSKSILLLTKVRIFFRI